MTNNNPPDNTNEDTDDVFEDPTYDEVVVDSITAAVVAAAYIGVAGLTLAGLQTLWPDPVWPLSAIEVTLTGIGVVAVIAGLGKGTVDAVLGAHAVRFWRSHRARTATAGGEG